MNFSFIWKFILSSNNSFFSCIKKSKTLGHPTLCSPTWLLILKKKSSLLAKAIHLSLVWQSSSPLLVMNQATSSLWFKLLHIVDSSILHSLFVGISLWWRQLSRKMLEFSPSQVHNWNCVCRSWVFSFFFIFVGSRVICFINFRRF